MKDNACELVFDVANFPGFCAAACVYDVGVHIFHDYSAEEEDYSNCIRFSSERDLAEKALTNFFDKCGRCSVVFITDKIGGVIETNILRHAKQGMKVTYDGHMWTLRKGKPFINPNTHNQVVIATLTRDDCQL